MVGRKEVEGSFLSLFCYKRLLNTAVGLGTTLQQIEYLEERYLQPACLCLTAFYHFTVLLHRQHLHSSKLQHLSKQKDSVVLGATLIGRLVV